MSHRNLQAHQVTRFLVNGSPFNWLHNLRQSVVCLCVCVFAVISLHCTALTTSQQPQHGRLHRVNTMSLYNRCLTSVWLNKPGVRMGTPSWSMIQRCTGAGLRWPGCVSPPYTGVSAAHRHRVNITVDYNERCRS